LSAGCSAPVERRLGRDALEYVVYEAVHDAHRLAADSRVRMNLLQHLVHVDRVALTSSVLPLLVSATSSLCLARRLFAPFDAAFGGIFTPKPYKKLTTKSKPKSMIAGKKGKGTQFNDSIY